jgi:hypothetical protein
VVSNPAASFESDEELEISDLSSDEEKLHGVFHPTKGTSRSGQEIREFRELGYHSWGRRKDLVVLDLHSNNQMHYSIEQSLELV